MTAMSCHHDHGSARTPGTVRQALDAIRARRGELRWTRPRLRVLEQLLEADGPVKPYDLLATHIGGGQPAKPATVYRALEFLENAGLAHRIATLTAYVACTGQAGGSAAFLICDCCGRVEEFAAEGDPATVRAADQRGFSVGRVTLEAHGTCADCR